MVLGFPHMIHSKRLSQRRSSKFSELSINWAMWSLALPLPTSTFWRLRPRHGPMEPMRLACENYPFFNVSLMIQQYKTWTWLYWFTMGFQSLRFKWPWRNGFKSLLEFGCLWFPESSDTPAEFRFAPLLSTGTCYFPLSIPAATQRCGFWCKASGKPRMWWQRWSIRPWRIWRRASIRWVPKSLKCARRWEDGLLVGQGVWRSYLWPHNNDEHPEFLV